MRLTSFLDDVRASTATGSSGGNKKSEEEEEEASNDRNELDCSCE